MLRTLCILALLAIDSSRWPAASADVNQPFALFNFCNPIRVVEPYVVVAPEDSILFERRMMSFVELKLQSVRLLRKVISGKLATVRSPDAPTGSASFLHVEVIVFPVEGRRIPILFTQISYMRDVRDVFSDNFGIAVTWNRYLVGENEIDEVWEWVERLVGQFILEYLDANADYC